MTADSEMKTTLNIGDDGLKSSQACMHSHSGAWDREGTGKFSIMTSSISQSRSDLKDKCRQYKGNNGIKGH